MSSSGRLRLWCILPGLVLLAGCATTTYWSGQTALHEGRYDDAAARFAEVLARDPEHRDALFGLGLTRYRMGAFGAAVGALGRAVLAAPDSREARLYLALSYLALGDQARAERQLSALRDLRGHPRVAAQVGRAVDLMRLGTLTVEIREFVRASLEDEGEWQREVTEARLAPHMYFGPMWFMSDPTGWSQLGWYPYGVLAP
jgi:tetratricopeptide (TPR) repeat protein